MTNTANNGEWGILLDEFHSLTTGKATKADYENLKSKAKNNAHLTFRQAEGIIARCENVLNGTYGNSKDNFEIGGKPSHKKEAEKK